MDTKAIFSSLPENLRTILKDTGINDLYPPQAEAVHKGLLTDKNMLLSMPTASGKTLMAELVMLKTIFSKKGNCLYIVPLRALASEKYDDFKEKYAALGITVGIATGDFDGFDGSLTQNDIMIATAEKIDSLLRQKPAWLCSRLACVVVDEIHYIGDPHRGPTLETVITRLLSMNSQLKLIGLSATIANAPALAGWLDANLVTSTWRPVVLKEGVYCQGKVKFADGSEREIPLNDSDDDIAALVVDCIREKGQALVFVNTRKSAQAEARRVAKELRPLLTDDERIALRKLAVEIDSAGQETTKLSKQLSECLTNGVVFHHAGLDLNQRKLIEDNFRKNIIKAICATPTLAVGVNLPSRRTIIRGLYRYVSGSGMKPVSVMEYKQMSGRAGRPKYDPYGEAIIVSKTKMEQGDMFNNFIFADTEPIHSHLGNESALRVHLLASIVTGFITSIDGAFSFIKKTFFSYQEKYYDLTDMVLEIIEFLEREDMIQRKDDNLLATAFGTRISRLYIDPISAVIIRDCLKDLTVQLQPLMLLYLTCSVPDMITLALSKTDIDKVMPFADANKEYFDLPLPLSEDYSSHLAKIKTVWLLCRWMEEEKEELLCDFFGIGPGDVHRFVETAEWLLYSSVELAKLFKIPNTKPLNDLRTRMRYGVKAELVELVNLRGVGRLRARNLFNSGCKTIPQIQAASLEKLQSVPMIGKEIAAAIKKQVEETHTT
ncbi:MAG: DEAD/DEAH box helicase [Candidatus Omnitrophica bacterium]|nr:DEAD/DEAH box helicase [Candidatus Omnitrophota bacterium]